MAEKMNKTKGENTLKKIIMDAIPDGTSWDELAFGITISFSFGGESYSYNSRVVDRPMTMTQSDFFDRVIETGINLTMNEDPLKN